MDNYSIHHSLRTILDSDLDVDVELGLKHSVDGSGGVVYLVEEFNSNSTSTVHEFDTYLCDQTTATSKTTTDPMSQTNSRHNLSPTPNPLSLSLSPPIGLSNLGATCYLNVLLQCLYHNPYIRQSIYNIEATPETNSSSSRSSSSASDNGEDVMVVGVGDDQGTGTSTGSGSVTDSGSGDRMNQMNKIVLCLQNIFGFMQYYYCNVYKTPDLGVDRIGGDIKVFTALLGLNTCQQQDPQEFNKLFMEQLDSMHKSALVVPPPRIAMQIEIVIPMTCVV